MKRAAVLLAGVCAACAAVPKGRSKSGMMFEPFLAGGTRPCDVAPLKGSPLCDTSQPKEARAAWIVSQLRQEEKVPMMVNNQQAVPRLGIPGYSWQTEALHGIAFISFTPPVSYATSFPQVITTTAAFNKTLWKSVAQAISTEGRAIHNAGHDSLSFWAPNINLFRDPRWGRGQETPGEDPYVTSKYAFAYVSGVQEGEDPNHVKQSACCKHYYAYDMENWAYVDRTAFNAIITKQDEADTYLPAFHSCVVNGRATGLMCSYNAVNGTPSCANERIMNGFAREQWGFEGYITSDCGAVVNVMQNHHYADEFNTIKDVLTAGMDSECGSFFTDNNRLGSAMNKSAVVSSAVDTALERQFALQIRLGMYDPAENQPYLNFTFATHVNTPAHQELALEAAREGMVLLKNTGNTFPLRKGMSIALVGPNANATKTLQGDYYGVAPYLISPLDGFKKYGSVIYAEGCDINCNDMSGFGAAKNAAASADATVIVIGIGNDQEGEGNDRTRIDLPGLQNELMIQVVAAAAGKPVMVVVMAGGSIDFSVAKNDKAVQGIMWVGYPGQSGGQAIAETIFGDNNPSGRLPHTQYPADYIEGLSMLDMNWRPTPSTANPGRSYRFYPGPTVYSFGDGLSYTTFTYQPLVQGLLVEASKVEAACRAVNEKAMFSELAETPQEFVMAEPVPVNVTNTGSRAGADVVLGYVVPPGAGTDGNPIRYVAGFEKVHLQPGESIVVNFELSVHALSLVDTEGARRHAVGAWHMSFGQSGDIRVPITVA